MARRIGTPGGTPERPAIFFKDAAEFGRWLAAHHDTETELWMGFYRKGHPKAGLTWEAAVREALCWGWIDSMAQGIDEHTRRQRWTPRKPTSNWSTININAVAELTAQGRMQPSGLAAFERRREDRSGIYAYENRDRELPEHYAAQLAADPAATAFWDGRHPQLPQARRQLGGHGQAGEDPRRPDGPARRRLRQRPDDPEPALRHRAQVGAAGGSGGGGGPPRVSA